ncbi:tRNA-(ms[2]io[6]A)-hydroxylase [Klebsiella aerogenes]|nr:tRNA-(ms[2]io[6]A)-hydroxylase [Klebsiella aerogenes]
MVCELKAAQNAMLLVRRYVADKADADELLACLKPYEDFTYRRGPEPDFVALHKRINKSAMPQTDDPWGPPAAGQHDLLIKEELHHFLAGAGDDAGARIPYVKITASNYARGLRREVRSHEPVMLIDKPDLRCLYRGPLLRTLCRPGAVAGRRSAKVLPVAAALRGASLSGLSGSGAEDCRRRYQRAGAPARRGGSGADPPSEAEFRFHSGVPVAA